MPLPVRLAFAFRQGNAAKGCRAGPFNAAAGHQIWRRHNWLWCSFCGAVASSKPRLLSLPCRAGASGGGAYRSRRLWQGRHPYSGAQLPDSRPQRIRELAVDNGSAVQAWADTLSSLMGQTAEEGSFPLLPPADAGSGEELPSVAPRRTREALGL